MKKGWVWKKRLEFEGTLCSTSTRFLLANCSSSRSASSSWVRRKKKSGKNRHRVEKELTGSRIKRARFNFRSWIYERSLWLLLPPLTFYVTTRPTATMFDRHDCDKSTQHWECYYYHCTTCCLTILGFNEIKAQ